MGLSSFPSASEGFLPLLVTNTIVSVALLKTTFSSLVQSIGCGRGGEAPGAEAEAGADDRSRRSEGVEANVGTLAMRPPANRGETSSSWVSITRFKPVSSCGGCPGEARWSASSECCVCLCRFEAEEEVSEVRRCRHLFHRACLDRWFQDQHRTCPLCRSSVVL